MRKSVWNRFLNFITFRSEKGKIQTFTYFIPSPPERKTGYREKQFDKVFYEFINQGYHVLDIRTVPSTSSVQSGFWFICTVRSTSSQTEKLNLDFGEEFEIQDDNLVYDTNLEILSE